MTECGKKKISLREEIYLQLKREIEGDVWKKEEKLPSEKALCERFSVSRITIRSAIQQLEALGMVETVQGAGTIVKQERVLPFTFDQSDSVQNEIIMLLEYRMVIEKGVVALTAERITDDQIKVLEENYSDMTKNYTDLLLFSHYDSRFHTLLSEFCGNPILIEATAQIQEHMTKTMEKIVSIIGSGMAIKYHRDIIDAFKVHDRKKAEEAIGEHLQTTIDGVNAYLEHVPDDKLL